MMKNIILTLLFSLPLFSQHISETFDSFLPDTSDNRLVSVYIFDISRFSNLSSDHKNSNDLTENGSVGDSTELNSVSIEGSSILQLKSSSSQFFNISSSSAGDFELSNKFTISLLTRESSGSDMFLVYKMRNGGSFDGYGLQYSTSSNFMRFWASTGASIGSWVNSSPFDINDGEFHLMALSFESGDYTFYGDLDVYGSGTHNIPNQNSSLDFRIGRSQSSNYTEGALGWVSISDTNRSHQWIKEQAYLADGWYSKNGGVARDNWKFHQGIVNDTVYFPIPDTTDSQWSVSYSDSAGSATTLRVGILKNGVFTEYFTSSANSTKANQTGTIGQAFTADSLAFITTGTVYIDDVVVTVASGSNPYTKYKNWENYYKGY